MEEQINWDTDMECYRFVFQKYRELLIKTSNRIV